MQIDLIDTHCHLDFTAFDHDRGDVVHKAADNQVTTIIVPSVSKNSWHKTITVSKQYNGCHLALGLHPVFIDEHQPQHLNDLDKLITKHKPIAVGEIGLDFYLRQLDQEKQVAFFSKQLIIAKQHKLPTIIHNRKAHDHCIKLLAELFPVSNGGQGGIIHAFNGSIQQAEKYIEMGFLLGFGGMLTFERSSKLRALVKALPLSSIVLETDAPDMTVAQHRGERNSPEYIPLILETICEVTGHSTQEVAEMTTNNARKVLRI